GVVEEDGAGDDVAIETEDGAARRTHGRAHRVLQRQRVSKERHHWHGVGAAVADVEEPVRGTEIRCHQRPDSAFRLSRSALRWSSGPRVAKLLIDARGSE